MTVGDKVKVIKKRDCDNDRILNYHLIGIVYKITESEDYNIWVRFKYHYENYECGYHEDELKIVFDNSIFLKIKKKLERAKKYIRNIINLNLVESITMLKDVIREKLV